MKFKKKAHLKNATFAQGLTNFSMILQCSLCCPKLPQIKPRIDKTLMTLHRNLQIIGIGRHSCNKLTPSFMKEQYFPCQFWKLIKEMFGSSVQN